MTDTAFRPAAPPKYPVPDTLDADLVILPREVDEDGVGHYEGALVDAVKRLRVEGVQATYLHTADERDWIGEKGFTPDEVALIIAYGGAAGWYVTEKLISLLKRDHDNDEKKPRLKLKAGKYTTHPDGTTEHEWLEAEGSFEEVAKAHDRFKPKELDSKKSDS